MWLFCDPPHLGGKTQIPESHPIQRCEGLLQFLRTEAFSLKPLQHPCPINKYQVLNIQVHNKYLRKALLMLLTIFIWYNCYFFDLSLNDLSLNFSNLNLHLSSSWENILIFPPIHSSIETLHTIAVWLNLVRWSFTDFLTLSKKCEKLRDRENDRQRTNGHQAKFERSSVELTKDDSVIGMRTEGFRKPRKEDRGHWPLPCLSWGGASSPAGPVPPAVCSEVWQSYPHEDSVQTWPVLYQKKQNC